jgi:hypothetical protein
VLDRFLSGISQKANHHVKLIITDQLELYRIETIVIRHIEESGFNRIIHMIPRRNLARAQYYRYLLRSLGIRTRVIPDTLAIRTQESRVVLVKVDHYYLKSSRPNLLQTQEHIEKI